MREIRQIGKRYEFWQDGYQIASVEQAEREVWSGLLLGGWLYLDELAAFIALAGDNEELRDWLRQGWDWRLRPLKRD